MLLLLLLGCLCSSKGEEFARELSSTYAEIAKFDKNDENRRSAIFTDKPVYRPGETVRITVYFYDYVSKRPLINSFREPTTPTTNTFRQSSPRRRVSPNPIDKPITIADGQMKSIGKASRVEGVAGAPGDPALQYKFVLPENFAGGAYFVQRSKQDVSFFVLSFQARSAALVGDWSQESAKPGDIVRGRLTLKQFTQTSSGPHKLRFSFSAGTKTLISGEKETRDGRVDVSFDVPKGFAGLLVFNAELSLAGQTLRYQKEFAEPSFDSVEAAFTLGTGRVVLGKPNEVYFTVWEDASHKLEMPVQNAQLVRRRGNNAEVLLENVSTKHYGKGVFEVQLNPEDQQSGSKFFLRVTFSALNVREFPVSCLDQPLTSPVLLRAPRLFSTPTVTAKLSSVDYNGPAYLVLVNKLLIVGQTQTTLTRGDNRDVALEVDDYRGANGGVFTLQLYLAPQGKSTGFPYLLAQESEVFVRPSKVLGASLDASAVNGKLKYSVALNRDCTDCDVPANAKVWALVSVVDASAFVEVERSRESPSLFAKVYLEREVLLPKQALFSSARCLDHFFQADKREVRVKEAEELNLLLGNQSFRKFLYGPDRLKELKQMTTERPFAREISSLLPKKAQNTLLSYAIPMSFFGGISRGFVAKSMQNTSVRAKSVSRSSSPKIIGQAAPVFEAATAAPALPAPALPAQEPVYTDEQARRDTILHTNFAILPVEGLRGSVSVATESADLLLRVWLVSDRGVYGYSERSVSVRPPFNAVYDLPLSIYRDEPLMLDVRFENNEEKSKQLSIGESRINLQPQSIAVHRLNLSSVQLPYTLEVFGSDQKRLLMRKLQVEVLPPGLPVTTGKSAYLATGGKHPLRFRHKLPASLLPEDRTFRVCANKHPLQVLLKAVERLDRQPHGCFEQTSSTNFPLVLGLQLLAKLPPTTETEQLRTRLQDKLRVGVKRLLGFECKSGGFEWFGHDPGHPLLTAYGYWQFREIQQLGMAGLFDPALFTRLEEFLLRSRDGKGGFATRGGVDKLGSAPENLTQLFAAFVLSGYDRELQQKFAAELKSTDTLFDDFSVNPDSVDSYALALLGLVRLNLRKPVDRIAAVLAQRQDAKSGEVLKATTSITRSSGEALSVETTALTVLFLLRMGKDAQPKAVSRGLKFITGKMAGGAFSSTQATLFSLLVLQEMMGTAAPRAQPSSYTVKLNDQAPRVVQEDSCLELSVASLVAGKSVKVEVLPNVSGSSRRHSLVAVELNYRATRLPPAPASPLRAGVTLSTRDDTAVYALSIQYNGTAQAGMLTYEFNKPSCYAFSLNDLENITKRGQADHYELRAHGSQLVLYFRGLAPGARKELSLSLLRRYPLLSCTERAHSAYLYYDKEGSIVHPIAG